MLIFNSSSAHDYLKKHPTPVTPLIVSKTYHVHLLDAEDASTAYLQNSNNYARFNRKPKQYIWLSQLFKPEHGDTDRTLANMTNGRKQMLQFESTNLKTDFSHTSSHFRLNTIQLWYVAKSLNKRDIQK
jgi:hypothetical protein